MNYYLSIQSFLICLLFTPVIRRISIRQGWVSKASNGRWNQKSIPEMGGMAIYLGIAIPLLLVIKDVDVLWIGITLTFMIGFFDDLTNVKPWIKLTIQIFIAALIVNSGYRFYWFSNIVADNAISILWIVGITNAFNLLDNMDGLATGVGIITSLCLTLLLVGTVDAYVALIVASSLTAFLFYNANPASIFMGDCGSLVIGFVLSTLCLVYTSTTKEFSALPIFLMAVPILDTSLVTISRIKNKRQVFIGGKDHLSHRLVLAGLSETYAVIVLWMASIAFVSVGLILN